MQYGSVEQGYVSTSRGSAHVPGGVRCSEALLITGMTHLCVRSPRLTGAVHAHVCSVCLQVRIAQQHRDHLKRGDRATRQDGSGVPPHLAREAAESQHNLKEVTRCSAAS